MSDRQLLELAAKAAGIRLEWDGDPSAWTPMYYEGKTYHSWNPLDEDGDALRLAVKLKIELDHNHAAEHCRYVCASRRGCEMCFEPAHVVEDIEDESQRLGCTRRAIVRAAAEIGKAMP